MAAATHLARFGERYVAKGIARLTNSVIAKGKGSYVYMEDGRKLLDFTTGIGVAGLGHCHPKISGAAAEQCHNLVHGQCSIAFHEPYLKLIEKLHPVMPDPSLDTFFFWNSGAEAVEASIKLARAATGRQNIIVLQGGYHGRTFGTMALTRSKTIYSEGVNPLMPQVYVTPFPYWHQLNLPRDTPEKQIVEQCLFQLEMVLQQQSAPRDTAAILIEGVLGEGGYVMPPASYMQGLREICDKHKLLLIVDEVQSGFARTGKMFSIEYSGVKPDVMVMAKGLANGFPLSGIVSRKELMDRQPVGTMGGTYAGNAVACAAAIAVQDVMKEENILENVNARSSELFSVLKSLQARSSTNGNIIDVRGKGLMVGVEFASPGGAASDIVRNPSAPKSLASRVAKKCLDKGMMILTTSIFEVVRFIPPLNSTQEEMKKGIEIFEESVEEAVKEG